MNGNISPADGNTRNPGVGEGLKFKDPDPV
jgi:hypothetical protein